MLALSGCISVGPDYVPPDTQPPARWTAPLGAGLNANIDDAQTLAGWWKMLDEPLLTDLIERAIAGNRDLAQAEARVREARARRGISDAERFPTLQASSGATRRRSNEETGSGKTTELYSAGLDASWETDLFGGKRRALEGASASLEASVYDLRDVLVSLVAEVALNYIETRAFQTRLSVAEANLQAQSETFDIARWRHEAGLATQRDVEQARLNLEQTRAQIPALRTGITQGGNRLAVLLGQNPGTLADVLAVRRPIPTVPADFAVGVPADALRRRPDVQRAERQLAAQTSLIGVATAALYPDFAIMGPSGSGKSTCMNILGCLDTPSAGSYRFKGIDVGRLERDQRARLRRHYLGFVFQGYNLLSRTSALENVELPLIYRAVPAQERHLRAQRALTAVGLNGWEAHTPSELSGGQQQRVAIARAIVTEPAVLFADEPTGNLDSARAREIIELLNTFNRDQSITIVMVTHEAEMAAYARRVIRFFDGVVASDEQRVQREPA